MERDNVRNLFTRNIKAAVKEVNKGTTDTTKKPYGPDGALIAANAKANATGAMRSGTCSRFVLVYPPCWPKTMTFLLAALCKQMSSTAPRAVTPMAKPLYCKLLVKLGAEHTTDQRAATPPSRTTIPEGPGGLRPRVALRGAAGGQGPGPCCHTGVSGSCVMAHSSLRATSSNLQHR